MALGHYTNNPSVRQQASQLSAVDAGLRAYMLRIYGYMTAGLGITGAVALAVSSLAVSNGQLTSVGLALYASPLGWIVMFAPLGVVLLMSFRINRMQASTAQMLFWVLAACYGVSLSSIFLVYTGESVVRVFFIAASMFLAVSVWGYTTKRSLSGVGSFLFMGMIGIFIAMLVNLFLESSGLQFMISILGVLIFAGLTAYDTQKLKEMYVAGQSGELVVKQAVMGALSLYLDFLMIFVFLLQLLGNRE